jgi:hypothetical protein
MSRFTPQDFFILYKEQLILRLQSQPREICDGLWTQRGDQLWTEYFAIPAAEQVCLHWQLYPKESSLRLDVAGFERREKDSNWDLRVAFAHEKTIGGWPDELHKLCHVLADLRVIVANYRRGEKDTFQEKLQRRIILMGDRMERGYQRNWLFILGPMASSKDRTPWAAFSLGEKRLLQPIPDGKPFSPYSAYIRRSGVSASDADART